MERNKKARLFILLSAAGLVVSILLGLCLGTSNIRPSDLIVTLTAGEADDFLYRILLTIRLPRVTAALLAGSALSVSGAIIQSVLNNPLASPNIIGVNAGAGLFVLLASAFLPPDPLFLPLSAFSGALLACMLVLAITMTGRLSRVLLVLTGFAVNSIFSAGMNTVMILYPDAYVGAGNFLVGGLSSVTSNVLVYPSAFIIAGFVLAMLCSRGLNILNLGGDSAKALGMNVNACRCACLAIAAILAGAAVSFAGMIGFVGLLVPHGVKLMIGQDNRFVLPASALTGGMFVILCDLLARTLFLPYELPVGILMSFMGGPFFLYLILKNRRKE
ncbi:MAG: iron ABC transporter permease [Hungatella sp.]|nr:iron ABC transporter permease [Hungatella sp.]